MAAVDGDHPVAVAGGCRRRRVPGARFDAGPAAVSRDGRRRPTDGAGSRSWGQPMSQRPEASGRMAGGAVSGFRKAFGDARAPASRRTTPGSRRSDPERSIVPSALGSHGHVGLMPDPGGGRYCAGLPRAAAAGRRPPVPSSRASSDRPGAKQLDEAPSAVKSTCRASSGRHPASARNAARTRLLGVLVGRREESAQRHLPERLRAEVDRRRGACPQAADQTCNAWSPRPRTEPETSWSSQPRRRRWRLAGSLVARQHERADHRPRKDAHLRRMAAPRPAICRRG